MLPTSCRIGLKEWAVTADALARGEQVLLLRKGGIHEEGKDFRVIHREFLLYPTYEHQREELLKPESRPALRRLLEQSPDREVITFSHWARAEEVLELLEQEEVERLSGYHIWTDAYAQSRLHWKPTLPLSVLLLRVYRLEQPVAVPWRREYAGCTSWVEGLPSVPLGGLEPVLTPEEFQLRVEQIKGSLGLAVTAG